MSGNPQIKLPIDPLDIQVGGSHYKKFQIQPVELYNRFGLGFSEANIIKYSMRHEDKNGKEDLEKVIHYADLMIKFKKPIGEFIPSEYIENFANVNGLTFYAKEIIEEIAQWLLNGSINHLENIQAITAQEIYDHYS